MKENEIVINGNRYALIQDTLGDNECQRCDLLEVCRSKERPICNEHFGCGESEKKRFEYVGKEGLLTEQQAYDDYQERSKTSGDRASEMAWMMITPMLCQLIGGEHYLEFYIMGAASIVYMCLSTLQSVWQTFAFWLIKCRIKSNDIQVDDYPNWVGFGAWVFYWLKITVITIGAFYGAYRLAIILIK